MTTKLEQLARAIGDELERQTGDWELPPRDTLLMARAVLLKLREPTPEMVKAGKKFQADYLRAGGYKLIFQAMIDAALEEE